MRTSPSTERIKLSLAYDGNNYFGWAVQPGKPSIQEEIQRALGTVYLHHGVINSPVVRVAGRTDARVHAQGQVVHFDLPPGLNHRFAVRKLARHLNALLPDDIWVLDAEVVSPDFDARFSAISRTYCYRLSDAPSSWRPSQRLNVARWRSPLNVSLMNEAAAPLLGLHNFLPFCRPRAFGTTTRELLTCYWERGEWFLSLHMKADAFCHHMVRSVAGALVTVGQGSRPVSWPADLLREQVRDTSVQVMPAEGLTLENIAYPAPDDFGTRALETKRSRK